jgi:hypothetical protein
MAFESGGGAQGTLETLKALLDTAARTAGSLGSLQEPLMLRWIKVLARMPAEDRELVVRALEHEVDLRLLTRSRDAIVGIEGLRPNPKARVYIRVMGGGDDLPDLTRDEIMRATLRAARIMSTAMAPQSDVFEEATLDAFRALTPAERAAIGAHNRQMLALLETATASSWERHGDARHE